MNTVNTVAFFNNKGGVGKTSLVYHLAWMFADRGFSTVAIDLDPQANLTAMFLEEELLEPLFEHVSTKTVFGCIQPLIKGTGDVARPTLQQIAPKLSLIAGDLRLSKFEDLLSEKWPKAVDGDESAFRTLVAFTRILRFGAAEAGAEIVLMDVGPNLGAINRSALLGASEIVIPLAPDLYSLQGLRNLGPTLRDWKRGWEKRIAAVPHGLDFTLPEGKMHTSGYVVMQFGMRDSRPVQAYQRWMDKIPSTYRESVLDDFTTPVPSLPEDLFNLASLRHYRSLMPLAMEAHKPIFFLKAADGAIGAHAEAVKKCYQDFLTLAQRIDSRVT
jgi:cellulose biosynthesis protein BcsQ